MPRERQQPNARNEFAHDGDFWGSGHDVHADFNPVPGNDPRQLNGTYFGHKDEFTSADRKQSVAKVTDFFGPEVFQNKGEYSPQVEAFAPGQGQGPKKGFMNKLRGVFGKH
jgi:hypothetical protein